MEIAACTMINSDSPKVCGSASVSWQEAINGRDVTIVRTDNRMVLQGLGIQISEEDMCKGKLKGVQITAVANKSQAALTGKIYVGDVIVSVGGESMIEASFGEVVTAVAMCGTSPGSEIKLRLAAPMDVLRAKPLAMGGSDAATTLAERNGGASSSSVEAATGAGGPDSFGANANRAESDGEDSDAFYDAADTTDVIRPWDTAPVSNDAQRTNATVSASTAVAVDSTAGGNDDAADGGGSADSNNMNSAEMSAPNDCVTGGGTGGGGNTEDDGSGESCSSTGSAPTSPRKHSTAELQIKAEAKLAVEGDEQWEKVENALRVSRSSMPNGAAASGDTSGNFSRAASSNAPESPEVTAGTANSGDANSSQPNQAMQSQEVVRKATEARLAAAEERKKAFEKEAAAQAKKRAIKELSKAEKVAEVVQESLSREEVMLKTVEQAKSKKKKKRKGKKKGSGSGSNDGSEVRGSSGANGASPNSATVGATSDADGTIVAADLADGGAAGNTAINIGSTYSSAAVEAGSADAALNLTPDAVMEEAKEIRDQALLRAARRSAKKEVEELQRTVTAQKAAAVAAKAATAAVVAVEAEADRMKKDDAQRLADATAATAKVLQLAAEAAAAVEQKSTSDRNANANEWRQMQAHMMQQLADALPNDGDEGGNEGSGSESAHNHNCDGLEVVDLGCSGEEEDEDDDDEGGGG